METASKKQRQHCYRDFASGRWSMRLESWKPGADGGTIRGTHPVSTPNAHPLIYPWLAPFRSQAP